MVRALLLLCAAAATAAAAPAALEPRPLECFAIAGGVRCGDIDYRADAPAFRALEEGEAGGEHGGGGEHEGGGGGGEREEGGEHGEGGEHHEEGEEEVECEVEEEAEGAVWWMYFAISMTLVCCAGLFSGLTIGLMSLDLDELRMISVAPVNPHHPHNHEYAKLIIPLVEDHHLLLVTLLLSNAAAMEALPIFLDKICPSPLVAILLSVTLVLFFGEVIPQALCTAYGLAIGAKTAPCVNMLIRVLYVIAKPIALLLDHIFGHEIKTLRRVDWIARLDLLAESTENPEIQEHYMEETGEKPLTSDEVGFMKGVLAMFDKKVSGMGHDNTQIMVGIDEVYSLPMSTRFDSATMQEVLKAGFSRIPVLEGERVHGIVLVKNLIMLDPDDATTMASLVEEERQIRDRARTPKGFPKTSSADSAGGLAHAGFSEQSKDWHSSNLCKVLIDDSILRVHQDISIFALIDLFQAQKTQMALVYSYNPSDPDGVIGQRLASVGDISRMNAKVSTAALRAAYQEGYVLRAPEGGRDWDTRGTQLIGVTTLEDIVEEMFGEQFVDETDPAFAMEMSEAETRQYRARPTFKDIATQVMRDTSSKRLAGGGPQAQLASSERSGGLAKTGSKAGSFGSRRMPAGVHDALLASADSRAKGDEETSSLLKSSSSSSRP